MIILSVRPCRPDEDYRAVCKLGDRGCRVETSAGYYLGTRPADTVVHLVVDLVCSAAVRLPSHPEVTVVIDHSRAFGAGALCSVGPVAWSGRVEVERALLDQLDLPIHACD